MSEISAEMIKDLRVKTGAGVLDCKKALTESQGDLEKAVEILRKSGAAKADKKSGRITAEGRIGLQVSQNKAALVEVNSETDFVAKNEGFQAFVDTVAQHVLETNPANLESLLSSAFHSDTLKNAVQAQVAKTGENVSIRRFTIMSAVAGEKMGSYLHMGNKIGVLVKVKSSQVDQVADAVLRDVAMHVAASNPAYLRADKIPAEILAKEREIYQEQLKDSGKPANVIEKILEGKLASFKNEVCLVSQIFVKDPTGKQTVADFLKQVSPDLEVVDYVRFQVGEGIQKKEEDFAAEVAKTING